MKRLSFIFALAIAAFLSSQTVAEAQILKNLFKQATSSTTTESAGTTNGKAAGSALKSLYTQYKADGKLDMSNLNNIMNAATLATNVKGLKGQTDKTTFYKDFASGLILGSENLVTSATSSNVMSGLSNLANNVDLPSLTEAATTAATNAATSAAAKVVDSETTSAISSILSLLK
jgi:hypothetical protein